MPDSDEGEDLSATTPAPGRRGQRQWQTRSKLIAGARVVFARSSVAEATIAQITEEADVGFGTFYLHFKTKEDVLHAVLVEGFASLNACVDDILVRTNEQQLPWEETIQEIVVEYLRFAHENRDLVQILFAEQAVVQRTEWAVFLRFAWRILQVLRRAQPSLADQAPPPSFLSGGPGAFAVAYPLNLLTTMIVSIFHRSAIWWLRQNPAESDEERYPLADVSALVAQFIIAGLSSVLAMDAASRRKDEDA